MDFLIEKLDGRARVGAARVRIADIGGEEFKEAIRRALADSGDKSGGAIGDDCGELVHGLMTLFQSTSKPAA